MGSKSRPPWEKSPRDKDSVHSPQGVDKLRESVKSGLLRFYTGISESMWRYDFGPEFDDMRVMSSDKVPEKFLFNNGQCVIFRDPLTEQCHILPVVKDGYVNMYGEMVSWHPMPVGTSEEMNRIRNLKLDRENSVLMLNDLFGGNDKDYIEAMVNELVDNTLTLNQLQLIAKCPFVFNVREGSEVSAKNFFLALCQDKPAIFTYNMGDDYQAVTESTQMAIDPALFELYDRFECMILEYIGFPCVPITKRAQQTVSEVQSNDAKLFARRQEKLRMRQNACERAGTVLGATMTVHSIIDEDMAQTAQDAAEGVENGTNEETEEMSE
jgi:hypothetical protein